MITRDTTLGEILKYPEAHPILAEFGVPCLGCPMAAIEMNKLTLGEICESYGINCEELIKKLNAIKNGRD